MKRAIPRSREAIAQPGDYRLLVGAGRFDGDMRTWMPGGVLPFGTGLGQRQSGATADTGVRRHVRFVLQDRLDLAHVAIGRLERRPFRQFNVETELPLAEGRNQINAKAAPDRQRPHEGQKRQGQDDGA